MAIVAASPIAEQGAAPTVRTCYDLLEVMRAAGMTDFTDGKYGGSPSTPRNHAAYLAAQERQAEYLLDQAQCRPGTRLLDIGCGYGRILEHAARRDAQAVGITISPPQVADCRSRGLDVYELSYCHIFPDVGNWEHAFEAVIANGSLEHFVQPADAAAGQADALYEEFFAICRRLLIEGGHLVTTAIHFRAVGQFNPLEIARGPSFHTKGSDNYHFAILARWFGGWYPEPSQLEQCAASHFTLLDEEDGTGDYHLTSEHWLGRSKLKLAFDPRVWWAVARQTWQHPRPALEMLRLQLWDESWAWQFRPPAPMRLLRQTWKAR